MWSALQSTVLLPLSGAENTRGRARFQPASLRTVSIVSASAAVLSGRYRFTRAKRSAIPLA
jgi:hypothetical protein